MEELAWKLPKSELHAHLNGSISERTLKKLLLDKKTRCPDYVPSCEPEIICPSHHESKSLDEIFRIFPLIHQLTDNEAAVYQVTRDVIEEFANDNVKYLELRTAPKCNAQTHMTYESYIQAVIKAIEESSAKSKIIVKLLLSIDRTRGLALAYKTVTLPREYANHTDIVVGLDLSGNPNCSGVQYLPMLKVARDSGLKLSAHLAELYDAVTVPTYISLAQYLTLPPDRIGHGTYLHDCCNAIIQKICEINIPFEMCLTSNIISGTVKSYKDHHLGVWCNKNPVIVCTDDKGIFGTTLSKEFALVARTFGSSENDLLELAKNGFKYAFCSQAEKSWLLHQYFKPSQDD